MSTKAKRHIHKYYRGEVANTKVWVCALSECNHYMPRHMDSHMPGKATLCWGCGEATTLTPDNLKREKPLCDDCKPTSNIDDYLREQGLINPISGK